MSIYESKFHPWLDPKETAAPSPTRRTTTNTTTCVGTTQTHSFKKATLAMGLGYSGELQQRAQSNLPCGPKGLQRSQRK